MPANLEGLNRELRIALAKVEDRLRQEGIPYNVTSGFRTRAEQEALYRRFKAGDPNIPLAAKPGSSRHESGLAVDISVSPKDQRRLNALAQEAGLKWHGPSDRFHFEWGAAKPAAPAPSRAASLFETRGEPAPKQSRAASLFEAPAAPAAKPSRAASLFEAPTQQRDSSSVGSMMSSLAKGEHLAPSKPTAPAKPSPFMPDFSMVPKPTPKPPLTSAPKRPQDTGALAWFSSLSNAYTGYLNQLGREGRKIPSIKSDPVGHFAALPDALKNAFAAGVKSFGPEAVNPVYLREMFGAQKGVTPKGLYNTLAVLDYTTSAMTDPTSMLAGPASKVAGKAISPLTRPIARAVEGGKLQAAVQKAERAREAATTSYGAAKAGGAGLASMGKHGSKLGKAIADEAAAQAAVGAISTTAGRVGAAAARSLPVKAALKVEQAAAAHLQQEATKWTDGVLKLIGYQKVGLLTRPATVATNTIGNVAAAEGELARHGMKLTALMPVAKSAKAELAALRQGRLVGEAAELEQHAPGVLGTLVQQTLGQAAGTGKTRNPLLEAQSAVDQAMKLAMFKALKPKLGAAEAAKRVKVSLFDYSDRSSVLQLLDRYGIWMFNAFPTAAAKSFIDTIVTRPDLVARFPRLQQQLLQEFPGSEEAYKKLRGYQKGPLVMPVGGNQFVDFGRFHPWTEGLGAVQSATRAWSDYRDVRTGGEIRPPEEREVLSSTGISPTLRTLRTQPKGATPEESAKHVLLEELQNRVPVFRDFQRLRAAWAGEGTSDRKFSEPQSRAKAVAQALAGVTTVRGELTGETKDRVGPQVNARAKTADQFARALDQAVDAGKLKVPEWGEGQKNFDEVKREFTASQKFFREMLLSPRNLTAEGKWTGQGKHRIREAYLRMRAIERRLNQLAE